MNNYTLVPVRAVRNDLVTQTDYIIYVPLATSSTPGIVQIGDSLSVTASGLLNVSNELLDTIASHTIQLTEKVDILHNQYAEAIDVTEDTIGYYYVKDENNAYNRVELPNDYVSGTIYYSIIKIGKFINDDTGVCLQYTDGEQTVVLKVEKDKVVVNNNKVVVYTDLISENISFNNSGTDLTSTNVEDALKELSLNINEIDNIFELGDVTILSSGWIYDNEESIYKYEFTNQLLTSAARQIIIFTPDDEAINNLNLNDILMYPKAPMIQKNENVAAAILKTNKLPNFDMTMNAKLQGVAPTSSVVDLSGFINLTHQILPVNSDFTLSGLSEKNFSSLTEKPTTLEGYGITDGLNSSLKGSVNGLAELDSVGKVPSAQLPSYVDDVLEFANSSNFPLTGETGKIYVTINTNKTYRWSGSGYVEISPSLALGETSSTAYRGDRGKTAYDHSQLTSGNPHNVTKSYVGLSNVYNPTAYGGISYGGGAGESGVSFTDLNSLAYTGFYTCYGTTANVPSASYSWFIQHINSNVGNVSATQTAIAYGTTNIIYKRNKSSSTWSAWENISPSLKENLTNKVTSISSSSTDTQYPSAKCVYDIVGNIVSLMEEL